MSAESAMGMSAAERRRASSRRNQSTALESDESESLIAAFPVRLYICTATKRMKTETPRAIARMPYQKRESSMSLSPRARGVIADHERRLQRLLDRKGVTTTSSSVPTGSPLK